MAHRPTLKDVAREAGISTATVDRAINGRAPVREETLQKIVDAARKLGYHGRGALEQRIANTRPPVRLGLLLQKEKQAFYADFRDQMEQAALARTDVQARLTVRFAISQSPAEFAELLTDLAGRCDAVGAVAVNHHLIDDTVRQIHDSGVPVFSLLNDFAQGIRRSYIGLNNIKVGRMAAWMLTQAGPPGDLAMFVGGNRWHGHDLREVGFRGYTREHAPDFTVLEPLVNMETRQVTYESTLTLLDRRPNLRGIYIAGGGMDGAVAALQEARPPGKVRLIAHERTAHTLSALYDGFAQMCITTPLDQLCAMFVDQAIRATGDPDWTGAEQHFIEPHVLLPEMI